MKLGRKVGRRHCEFAVAKLGVHCCLGFGNLLRFAKDWKLRVGRHKDVQLADRVPVSTNKQNGEKNS